ncbi:MAG: AraC-like DNA-binding protein [Arenicella sp.]|jgi:AraC-like DNA-binding protein
MNTKLAKKNEPLMTISETTSRPFISNQFLIHLDRIYLERGGDFLKVMSKAGLPYELLVSEYLMVPFESHNRMLELSETELGVKPLGLVLATRQSVAHLSPLFDALLRPSTVEGSIVALAENLYRVAEGLDTSLKVDDELAYVEMKTNYSFLSQSSIFHDHAAGLLAQYLRWIIGRDFKMKSVSIPHSEPRNLSRFRSFFGCPVSFGDSHIAICFEKSILQRPVIGKTDDLNREYNEVLDWDRSASLLAQVRTIIRRDLALGSANIEYAADALKLSKRTLQRRLADRKTSFHKQLDSVRAGLARHYIYQKDLDLSEIASRLGYAEQACFTHAFVRWYAKPPSVWRALLS